MTPLTPEEIAAIHALVETFRQGTDNAESLPELMQAVDRLADALTAETQRADLAGEAPDLPDAITDEQLADITNGDVKGYLQNLVYILHKLQTERDQLAAEVKRWKGTAEALRQTENAELLLLRQDVAEQAERWGKLREMLVVQQVQTMSPEPYRDGLEEGIRGSIKFIDSLSVPAEPERQAPAVGAEQAAMLEWFTRNGGKTDIVTAVKRAEKELAELLEAAQAGDLQHVREESADVTLCLMLVATLGEYDLLKAVRWKQAINNARRWRADEYGCLYHTKGSDPRDLRACKNLACQLAGMHTFSCEKEFEHSEAVQSSRPQAHHGRGCRCEECKIENYSLEVPQGAQSGDAAASVSDGGSKKSVEPKSSTEQVLRELREAVDTCLKSSTNDCSIYTATKVLALIDAALVSTEEKT